MNHAEIEDVVDLIAEFRRREKELREFFEKAEKIFEKYRNLEEEA